MFEEQINILKNYDIYDVIARVSGLCLEPKNQNTSLILDAFIDEITERNIDEFTGKAIISDKKFRSIINAVSQNEELRMMVDPPENTFTQNVMFYGNYRVFNGIDNEPAFQLQMMLDAFCHHIEEYPKKFIEQVLKVTRTILQISDVIYHSGPTKSDNVGWDRDIYVSDGITVRQNAQRIVCDGKIVRRWLEDECLLKHILLNFGHRKSADEQNRQIFSHPLLYNKENDLFIVLDVGLLPQFAIYCLIMLSGYFNIKEQFIHNFNEEVFENVVISLDHLGHHHIDSNKAFGIDILKNEIYWDSFFSIGSKRIIYLSFIIDDCEVYNSDALHSTAFRMLDEEELSKRIKHIKESVVDKVGEENVYHIVCINSIGRTLGYANEFGEAVSSFDILKLTPLELWCISVNERKSTNFIPRYVRAKNLALRNDMPDLFSELDNIVWYKNFNYSFYFTDEAPIDSVYSIQEHGDSVRYLEEAYKASDFHQVVGPFSGIWAKVLLEDPVRKIYNSGLLHNRVAQFIEIFSEGDRRSGIWLIGDTLNKDSKRVELIYTSVTFLSYWFGECKDSLKKIDFTHFPITIRIDVVGNEDDFLPFHEENRNKDISEVVDFTHKTDGNGSYYNLKWTPKLKDFLIYKNNGHEKKLIKYIVEYIVSIENAPTTLSELDKVFLNPLKKKMYFSDVSTSPCNRPLKDLDEVHLIDNQDEEYIHDVTGPALVKAGKWKPGKLSGDNRCDALNVAVDYLYKRLVAIVATLNPEGLIEQVYHDIEGILYHILRLNDCFANEIRCYPERKENFFEEYNTENKTLAAAKFLIEYLSACPPHGSKKIDSIAYEYLLAICSTILMYAHQSDSFKYNIYNDDIEILRSGRLGLDHDSIDKMASIISNQRMEEMDYYSSKEVESIYSSWIYKKELTDSFYAEFGYSDHEFIQVVLTIIAIGENENVEIHVWQEESLVQRLENSLKDDLNVKRESIKKIINDLVICQRDNFLKSPKGFKKWEVWPWRFDRRYSFTRRPIVKRGTELIWGDRSLYRMLQYVFLSIQDGSFRVESQQFKDLLGMIGNDRGKHFNEIVAKEIENMNAFAIYTNIDKVNNKYITDENNNSLGDIDVLAIDKQHHMILPIEVKSFKQARNPYEVNREHEALFADKDSRKSYVRKHRRRVEWCKNHLEDFKEQFNLEQNVEWKIRGIFVVNQPQISKYAFHENVSILTRAELTLENLLKAEK